MSAPNHGGTVTPPPVTGPGGLPLGEVLDPEAEELYSSRALLIVLLLLVLSFWVSYYLKVRRIRSVHETIVALFSGMFVGLLVRLSPGNVVQDMISFKSTILLNVLLPPIILNSGYQLKQDNFFRNFGVILSFAFAGTFISAVALGVIVYIYSLLGLEGLNLTIIECLQFGSTLSATDPVTILAIFNALHVDPKLYSVIFGESILNDAVAIVMFETLSQFHGEHISLFSLFHGTGIFLLTFFISMALGVIFGLGCSLMLKHSELGRYTEIESCLVFLIAYTSYFFSNALTMSGIVSLLFCGITLKHYAYHNMSHRTQRTSRYMFGMLAQLSENFIFIYLGLSLFTQADLVYKPMFILVTAVAVCIARYCAVFPISKVVNMVFKARGSRTDELPHSYQMMLFWAGLRGAVGVALAAGIQGENAVALRTTVLVTVVLTVVVFGGTIQRMIEILGIRTGVEDDDPESSEDEGMFGMEDIEARRAKRRSFPIGKNYSLQPQDPDDSLSPHDSPYRDRPARTSHSASRLGTNHPLNSFRPSAQSSDQSISSEDSDADVLPPVGPDGVPEGGSGDLTRVWRDGQWFTVLDQRFLLPTFSNATAQRKEASKKALLKAKRKSFVDLSGTGHDEEEFGGPASAPGSPYLSEGINRAKEFNGSFTDILSSLVAGPSSSPNNAIPPYGKRRNSDENRPRSNLGLAPSPQSHNRGASASAVQTGTSTPVEDVSSAIDNSLLGRPSFPGARSRSSQASSDSRSPAGRMTPPPSAGGLGSAGNPLTGNGGGSGATTPNLGKKMNL